jgi:hypothetical protein
METLFSQAFIQLHDNARDDAVFLAFDNYQENKGKFLSEYGVKTLTAPFNRLDQRIEKAIPEVDIASQRKRKHADRDHNYVFQRTETTFRTRIKTDILIRLEKIVLKSYQIEHGLKL